MFCEQPSGAAAAAAAAVERTSGCREDIAVARRLCQTAAPPSAASRRFNMDGEGASAKWLHADSALTGCSSLAGRCGASAARGRRGSQRSGCRWIRGGLQGTHSEVIRAI